MSFNLPSASPTGPPDDGATFDPADTQPAQNAREVVAKRQKLELADVVRIVGPGLISGSTDNDPAGITTYSVIGAQNGFTQHWLLLLATPLLIVVQQMSAKIGNVTKTDFATVIRTQYGVTIATIAVSAVVIANLIALGADLEMLAAVTGLVTGIKFIYFVVPFAALMVYVSIFVDYPVFARYLLWISIAFLAYIGSAILAQPNWGEALLATLVPPNFGLTPISGTSVSETSKPSTEPRRG